MIPEEKLIDVLADFNRNMDRIASALEALANCVVDDRIQTDAKIYDNKP